MTSSVIAQRYDLSGEEALRSPANYFSSRYDDLVLLAARVFMEQAIPPVTRADRPALLDLCCGTGSFSIYPATLGYMVQGVDLSPKSIEAANRQARMNGVEENCRFEVGDVAEYLRHSDRMFDVISIAGSLYYLDRSQVVPMIRPRLKPGGVFLCLETNGSNVLMNVYRRLRNWVTEYRDSQTLHGLLRLDEHQDLALHFTESELHRFDFLTLATPVFGWSRTLAKAYYRLSSRLDRLLLNRGPLRNLAFKVIFIGR